VDEPVSEECANHSNGNESCIQETVADMGVKEGDTKEIPGSSTPQQVTHFENLTIAM
jgi:hypothetical protein